MRTRLDSRLDDWSPSGLVSRVCGVARRFLAWRHCDVSLLLVLVIGITAANLVWRTLETRPPHFDMAGHLRVSLEYADYLDGGNLFDFLWSYHYYPPMIYWSASLFYTMSGHEDIAVAVASNALFLTVLAISTYAIGRRLGGRLAGLLASFFVLTTPMLVTQFKEYQTDAPLTAMVALSLYFLIVANGFSNRQASILLGVAAGLGALTKWSFLLTMLLPVLFGVAVAIRTFVRGAII